MKTLYFITILFFLIACGGESSSSTKPPIDNNQTVKNIKENNTTNNNQTISDGNITSDNNQTITDGNITSDNNQTISDGNITSDNNQTISDGNITSDNNQTITDGNITSDNNQTITDRNITSDNNQTITDTNSTTDNNHPIIVKKSGKAQLGVLSKATVKLYELNGLEKKLLATTVTSSGETIENIGNFNLYLEKLEDNKFYLYEVNGGEDYDVDDNGVIDNNPTPNQGIFHLLVLGSHIKAIQKATVTVISEVTYQKLLSSLSLENSKIKEKMKEIAKELIQEDINGDGFVGIEDILKYNPILDKTKLHIEYQNKIDKLIDDILNNKSSDLDAPKFTNPSSTIQINENLTFIKKIEIEDKSQLSIKLLEVDASNFIYNQATQELSLIKKADFENPHDSNRDNIFELTIEATDSYFNQTTKEFSIEIVDINETIPQIPILEVTNLSIYENNSSNTLIGSVTVENQGTSPIDSFTLKGAESQDFIINKNAQIFSSKIFDYEAKSSYTFQVEAINAVGKSNQVEVIIQIKDTPDIKPTVQNVSLTVSENLAIGTVIGKINITDKGDSNISTIQLSGVNNSSFQINLSGNIKVNSYLDYESYNLYYLQYTATNKAGESEPANLTISVSNIFENSGSDYPSTESGIQTALDNGDYSFVLNQLLNNRDAYSGLDGNEVNMNIAGAYVGSSGYTVFDITGAMSDGNQNNFNDFVNNITQNNDPVTTINKLSQADTYYSNIVQGLDCTNTATLTQIQKDSCYNLGLVRMTSLTNSVKLLFGGDSDTVKKWSDGVDVNSSDDLNGNGVLDNSEASACAIVYANNPNDNCQNGTIYSYRGGVNFNHSGTEENLTLIEVDVGNSTNGYQSFYQLISSKANNNTPILTSGVCDKNFNSTTQKADGVNYFPCPVHNESQELMGIKESIENVANIQALFPTGDETKATLDSYMNNITGDANGTIGLDNLSTYLRTH